MDIEASRAIRQAEVGAARTMIERMMDRFGLYPEHLAGDSAYGASEMVGWLVEEQGIEPHVAVIDKSKRKDGTFSRNDFFYDQGAMRHSDHLSTSFKIKDLLTGICC